MMICQLKQHDHTKISNLLKDVKNCPEVKAIVEGNNPGEIYVDDITNPNAALVWSQGMEGFYLLGNEEISNFNNQLRNFIDETIIPKLSHKGIDWFEVSGVTKGWNTIIEEAFKDKGIDYGQQLIYLLKEENFSYDTAIDHHYSIEKVEKRTFEANYQNIEFLQKELEQFWGTIDTFLQNGIGYYALENNKIVSICYSGFKKGNIHAIGIETLNESRKKGYAYGLSHKFIKECLERSLIPYWDCSEDNIPSKLLAEKLGFSKEDQYRCYWFNF